VAKCAYRGERIKEIEEKWIDENVEDEEERMRKKSFLSNLLGKLGGDADCRLDAIPGEVFCIFHDPNYWREHADEVRNEFQKRLKERKERFFIGFHLPSIEFPDVVENDLHMELVKFHDTLEASSTKFEGSVYFDGATFLGVTQFLNATFKESAQFIEITFKELASVVKTDFHGVTSFDNATFKKQALFIGVTFQKSVRFTSATFLGKASFDGTTFRESASYNWATLNKLAWFAGAKFYGETSFIGTKFKEYTKFDGTEFLRRTLFDGSVFSGPVSFKDSVFLPDLLEGCLDPNNYVSFSGVDFGESERVVFDGCRMRGVSFIYTDVRRLVFRNVDWGEDFRIYDDKLFLIKIGKGRESFLRECEEKLKRILDVLDFKKVDKEVEKELGLYKLAIPRLLMEIRKLREKMEMSAEDKKGLEKPVEEELKELRSKIKKNLDYLRDSEQMNAFFKQVENKRDLTLDNVLAVYRGLRDNYDFHLRYEESGRFFINEMRLRRIVGKGHGGEKLHGLGGVKLKLSNIIERGVMWAYEMLALYGESYARPILWAILLIVLSSLIRPLWLWMQNPGWRPELDFILKQVKTSILVFFQLQWDTKTLTIVERVLSIPILGTLYLALRRKLERRMRH
jgi:uncharacterized protein YjbI with pentapeptide repeats